MTDKRAWKSGWEDARRRQLIAGLEATPAQRLAWLEEMIVLAYRSGALPRWRFENMPKGGFGVKYKYG